MNFKKVFERIKKETSIQTLKSLAEFLGCTQQNVSAKKVKNEFPVDWAYKVAKSHNLLTEWILEGTGAMRPGKQNDSSEALTIAKQNRKYKAIEYVEMWLDKIVKEDPAREDWFDVQLKIAFPEYLEWRKNREAELENSLPQDEVA